MLGDPHVEQGAKVGVYVGLEMLDPRLGRPFHLAPGQGKEGIEAQQARLRLPYLGAKGGAVARSEVNMDAWMRRRWRAAMGCRRWGASEQARSSRPYDTTD